MKILHVIPGVARRYGGPSTVIFEVVAALNKVSGVRAEIATTDADGKDSRISATDLPLDAPVHLFRKTCSEQWKLSIQLRNWLQAHVHEYDLIHIHALWSFASAAAARAAARRGVPYVIRPAGMLSEWSVRQGRLKKWIAWQGYQKRQLVGAKALHATSIQEAKDIRAQRLCSPIAVIRNGVAIPEHMPTLKTEGDKHRVLFLGRIHPVKGLCNLIRAWKQVDVEPEWELVLAGPDEGGHLRELEELARDLNVADSVRFVGALSDTEKWNWYKKSDVFILPSFTENFSVAVAEALGAELPVITTTGTPWGEIRERSCGWWVDPTVEGLATALKEALAKSDQELKEMGGRGSTWIRSRFTWPAVAEDLCLLYRWLVAGGPVPQYMYRES